MRRRLKQGWLLLPAAVLVATCCGAAPTFPTVQGGQFGGRPVLGIENGTPLAVTVFVNGKSVGTATPDVAMAPIDVLNLPPMPWTVEARAPSGRVLTTMNVKAGDVSATTDPSGNLETGGTIGRVDLSCGRITIWAGYSEPSGPAPPSPAGSPGDCAP
jgi:hypothetical protein